MSDSKMLTTTDNPFNPFTDFEQWLFQDQHVLHYGTCERLALIAEISSDFPDTFNQMCIDEAMKQIVKDDVMGVYRVVTRKDFDEKNRLIQL